jgi:uncharacterized membrane protein YhaH (DUF805 family)
MGKTGEIRAPANCMRLVMLILPFVYSAARAEWIIVILIAAAFAVIVSGFIQLLCSGSTTPNTEKQV